MTECDLDLRVGGRFNTVFDVDGQKWTIKVFSKSIPAKAGLYRRLYRRVETGRKAVYDGDFVAGRSGRAKPAIRRLRAIPRKKSVSSMNRWASMKAGDRAGSAGGVCEVSQTPLPEGEGWGGDTVIVLKMGAFSCRPSLKNGCPLFIKISFRPYHFRRDVERLSD